MIIRTAEEIDAAAAMEYEESGKSFTPEQWNAYYAQALCALWKRQQQVARLEAEVRALRLQLALPEVRV